MGWIQSTHTVSNLSHNYRPISLCLFFSLTCLPVEPVQPIISTLLDFDSLLLAVFHSEWTHIKVLFYISSTFSSPSLTFPPASVALLGSCATSVQPPSPLCLWTSPSGPVSFTSTFTFFILYTVTHHQSYLLMPRLWLTRHCLCPQVFMCHCGGSQLLLELYFISVENRIYCICTADRKHNSIRVSLTLDLWKAVLSISILVCWKFTGWCCRWVLVFATFFLSFLIFSYFICENHTLSWKVTPAMSNSLAD